MVESKLYIDNKYRKIHQDNNFWYYKSNNKKIDITYMFVKGTNKLKKKYNGGILTTRVKRLGRHNEALKLDDKLQKLKSEELRLTKELNELRVYYDKEVQLQTIKISKSDLESNRNIYLYLFNYLRNLNNYTEIELNSECKKILDNIFDLLNTTKDKLNFNYFDEIKNNVEQFNNSCNFNESYPLIFINKNKLITNFDLNKSKILFLYLSNIDKLFKNNKYSEIATKAKEILEILHNSNFDLSKFEKKINEF